jgi:hypothetical protein
MRIGINSRDSLLFSSVETMIWLVKRKESGNSEKWAVYSSGKNQEGGLLR